MVAITVILAAVIGTFVLGIGQNIDKGAPQASFQFDFEKSSGTVDITHQSGPTIDGDAILTVKDTSGSGSEAWSPSGSQAVSAGDTYTYTRDAGGAWDKDTVRVLWESPEGGDTATIAQAESP